MAAITDLTTLAAADVADGDWLPIHDLSAGTDKKVARSSVLGLSGSFTPRIEFGGATTGITYTTQTGYYHTVGNRVWISVALVLSSKGSATGTATIAGLPYTLSSVAVIMPVFWGGLGSGVSHMVGFFSTVGSAAVTLRYLTTAATSWSTATDAIFANTTSIYMTGDFLT